jgi:hypothetical protein
MYLFMFIGNGQKKKYKETNNDIQNTTNKYGAICTPTKTQVLRKSGQFLLH